MKVSVPESKLYQGMKLDVAFDKLKGQLLKNRYRIDNFVDKGQYGSVYTVTDVKAKTLEG